MRILKYLFLLIIFVLGLGAGFAYFEAKDFLSQRPVEQTEEQFLVVDILPGSNLNTVAKQLEAENIITNADYFALFVRYKELDNKLQAGRFEFSNAWTVSEVLDKLVFGKPLLYRITLREGLTWWEVAKRLDEDGFCRYEDFKTVIHDPAFLQHFMIPYKNAEGFLYPETYLLDKPDVLTYESARRVAYRLVDTFWQKADTVWKDGKRPSRDELKRLVTLASIVEKETGIPSERAKVSGVYTNRLRIGMLLQADPTVIYGLGETFSGQLLKRHLEDKSNLYNTYAYAGLPPGPIASFGLASLKAAINPEEHKYLYFVATGLDGGHTFSTNLNDHNKAVQEYRRNRKL